MTDGLPADRRLGAKRAHPSVNPSDHAPARTNPTMGSCVQILRGESFSRFLRCTVVGAWYTNHANPLGRSLGETAFRWNQKTAAVSQRMVRVVRMRVSLPPSQI